jgi:hypothetical protein
MKNCIYNLIFQTNAALSAQIVCLKENILKLVSVIHLEVIMVVARNAHAR